MKRRIHIILAFLLSAITSLWAQTYSIGDLIVNDDGSKGIVFYVTPDRTDGWMVALNDLPTHNWGLPLDIASLQNLSNPNALLSDTDGLTHTEIIRQYHSDNGYLQPYGAGIVDFEHGWYIPSSGQLMKLCSVLSMISDDLIRAGGSTLDWQPYFTSTESTTSNQIWTVDFGSHSRDWGGSFVSTAKSSEASFRAVRNIRFENTPLPEPTYPDNVIQSNCNRPLEGNPWDIQLLHSSAGQDVASYSPILVGDIDGNGVSEIVVAKYNGNNYRSREINVYSGRNLSLQHSFIVPDTIYLSNGPYAIGRYPKADGTMEGAIFTHCYDKKIRAYSINGTLLNVSDRATSCDGMVSLADFNGDGFPEVYAGSDIFDAATLKWLCSGPANGNKGLGYRGTPAYSNGTYHHTYYAMSLAYNALGDATQELICGNTIYNVNIVSRTNPNLNSITVAKTITPPNGFSSDGHVSLADFDLDGETEVLVIRDDTNDQIVDDLYFYAYKPSNGQILFQKAHRCASSSYVFIGNTDTEPYPEIVFLENQPNGYDEKIFCWRYTPQNGLQTVWSQYHDDRSGQTAMTLFDFNQDNIMELVYRDNNNLRIINASGKSHITGNDTIRPYNIFTRRMAAGTGCEYPVVADVNGDGVAEIVATGLIDQYVGYDVGYGGVHVFGSPNNWSSARPVWNQYMYHVTNVNEDLTIPTYCFNTATVFTAPDGTIRRPYNNFLQQASYITQYGEPIGETGEPQYVDIYDIFHDQYTWNGNTFPSPGDYTFSYLDIYGCDSIVTLHLSPIPSLPDNILESDCNTSLEGFEWGIREDWSSGDNIYCRINPLVGDLDDDGIPEIVCFDMMGNNPSQTAAKTINVYDGRDKYLKAQINVEGLVWAHGNGPYGLVKLPNREGLIVTACKDSKLYAYNISLANPDIPIWVSDESYNTGYNDFSVSIGFADFNGDGHPEVYVRDKIFNAETGVLLATAQGGSNQADSYSHNSHTNHNKLSCPLASDICGDARQELILGNEIYDVVITNPNGTTGNHVTLTKSITPPNGIINDGHVQVADFNLDGHPDILISNRDTEGSTGTVSFYVWDVFNNRTSLPIQLETHFTGKSVPLIADFNNDGFVEILIDCCHENDKGLRAYRFNPVTNGFSFLWSLPIDEDSYSNTATLFDFNADGKNELIYTDNSYMRVYDLSTTPPTEISTISCGEISIMQVPIVADVDNDGSAEIVVTGKANGYMQANTMLKVYKSSTEPWRNARKVWNQYMYHVTNVNEDLTIPSYCFNNATIFTAPDGTIRRPYNNFLQQAGYITPEGEPYNPGGTIEVDVDGVTCTTFTFNGITYDEGGLYEQTIESEEGCDTLYRIMVTITDAYQMEYSETICGEAYVWNGTTYTETGDYQQEFTSTDGCDSIVTLHLNVFDAYDITVDTTVCGSFVWAGHEYTQSGHYEQAFVTANGCDSVFKMDLTVLPYPEAISEIIGPQEIFVATDLVVGQYFYFIDPVSSATHYEWTLVGADWVMDATGTQCALLVTTPGTATLKVRAWNDCGYTEQEIIIHAGFHDVDDNQAIPVKVYPNPAHDKVFIEAEGIMRVRLFDLLGQCLTESVSEPCEHVELSLQDYAASLYLVEIQMKNGIVRTKLKISPQ